MLKETESTTIVVAHFGREEQEAAEALAGNYPERVKAVPYVAPKKGDVELVPFLLSLIGEK
jgi:hypothetical protein